MLFRDEGLEVSHDSSDASGTSHCPPVFRCDLPLGLEDLHVAAVKRRDGLAGTVSIPAVLTLSQVRGGVGSREAESRARACVGGPPPVQLDVEDGVADCRARLVRIAADEPRFGERQHPRVNHNAAPAAESSPS